MNGLLCALPPPPGLRLNLKLSTAHSVPELTTRPPARFLILEPGPSVNVSCDSLYQPIKQVGLGKAPQQPGVKRKGV